MIDLHVILAMPADLSIESHEVLDDFQLLIEDAVSITDKVVVSSRCSRLNDSRANRMVDAVNARLKGQVEGFGFYLCQPCQQLL